VTTRRTTNRGWVPAFGAWPAGGGTRFRVWAPTRRTVELLIDPAGGHERRSLTPGGDGCFAGTFDDVPAGTPYKYVLDDRDEFPDPASRWQPDGVHGASVVVDPGAYSWSDEKWDGISLPDLVIYELHVGTFSPSGTFAGVADRLPSLRELGVTAIELMPVADFPGMRNWGYDGASLYAPAHAYGAPDDLRRLVEIAHGLGLAVLLDVVYNHFGPDGAYAVACSPLFLSERHQSPWGAAVNVDGPGSEMVRAFFIDNALHWLHEYHFDGLRLDATHAIVDDKPQHVMGELASRVRSEGPRRLITLIAEDDRNLSDIVRPEADGGWGFDAVWSDDFHHEVRALVARDRDGYFADFAGTTAELAAAIERGWLYTGQHSTYREGPRGTDPVGIPRERMVTFLQNHDQIGNRAFGERLHHDVDLSVFRAVTALWLLAPETPLLFMGQEWAASTPFLFFTDHEPGLGRSVTEGRRREFSRFAAFADEEARARIPDPQALSTFEASRLVWEERRHSPHSGILRLHAALLALRKSVPSASVRTDGVEVTALDQDTIALVRDTSGHGEALLVVSRVKGAGVVDVGAWRPAARSSNWRRVLGTDDAEFTAEASGATGGPHVAADPDRLLVTFDGPSAIVLRGP
jgi:maltooligosyltrehalose trehalohydrolase